MVFVASFTRTPWSCNLGDRYLQIEKVWTIQYLSRSKNHCAIISTSFSIGAFYLSELNAAQNCVYSNGRRVNRASSSEALMAAYLHLSSESGHRISLYSWKSPEKVHWYILLIRWVLTHIDIFPSECTALNTALMLRTKACHKATNKHLNYCCWQLGQVVEFLFQGDGDSREGIEISFKVKACWLKPLSVFMWVRSGFPFLLG